MEILGWVFGGPVIGFVLGHWIGMKEGRLVGRADAESEAIQNLVRKEILSPDLKRPSVKASPDEVNLTTGSGSQGSHQGR